jgi:hypothetical protein
MKRLSALLFCVTAALAAGSAGAVTVFSTDFESGLPAEFSAPGAVVEPVQGYAGLGAPPNEFAGSFLRYASTEVLDTDLVLTGLPLHDTLHLGFLLAVIDSWDGVELLQVSVDGAMLFSHSFQLATGDSSSYAAPPGGLLSSGTDLGFTGGGFHDHDRAYDMTVEPVFMAIPHTADSVTIRWSLNATPGGGASFWQGGADESWAIENVTVDVETGLATTSTSSSSSTTSSTTSSSSTSSVASSTTTTTTSTVTTATTITVTTTTVAVTTTTTTTTTTTLPDAALLLPGKKLLVKQKKSGSQRLQLIVKDAAVAAAQPCEVDGELVIEAVGAGAPAVRFPLEAGFWKPIKAKRPEKGCKYRRGPVVATVLIKTAKTLQVIANAPDLGMPLATDPRPVRIEVRHGDVRHCVAFDTSTSGGFKAEKKLLAKKSAAPPGCLAASAPSAD